jgi:hypothetical protein
VLLLTMWGPAILRIKGFYVPELLVPPLAVYLWCRQPRVVRAIFRCMLSPAGIAGALWLTFVAVLGVLSFKSFVGPYSEWRASILLLYCFLLLYTREAEEHQRWSTRLMWVSFAVLSLDTLLAAAGILRPGFLGMPMPDADEAALFGFGRISVPAINIVVVSYLAARRRRIGLLAAALVLGGVLSLGGHRVLLAATGISALLVPIVMISLLRSRRVSARWLRLVVPIVLILGLIGTFRSSVIQNYLAEARGIQNRLFTHTFDTLSGIHRGVTGSRSIDYGDEAIRAAYAAYVLTQWPSLLLPHGLGSREVEGRLGPAFADVALRWRIAPKDANTHDNAVLYAAYHHGLIATVLTALVLGWLLLRRLLVERGILGLASVIVAVGGVVLIDMIYPPVPGINIACVYGLFLGSLLNRSIRHSSTA